MKIARTPFTMKGLIFLILPLLFILTALRSLANEVKVTKDVIYGTGVITQLSPKKTPEEKQIAETIVANLTLDVYQPMGVEGKRPGILLVHGGGWFSGDKADKEYVEICQYLATEGFAVFSVNYRLVPKARYPAQLDDVQRAVRWVRKHADDYSIDIKKIGAVGDSAGGHLVSLLGTRDTRDNSDADLKRYSSKVQCVVDLFGPVDFLADNNSKLPGIAEGLVTNLFGQKRVVALDLYKEGSPITYVNKESAHFLIMHGDKDPLVPLTQSREMKAALDKAGNETELIIMVNEGHGFKLPENRLKQKTETIAFFNKWLKP